MSERSARGTSSLPPDPHVYAASVTGGETVGEDVSRSEGSDVALEGGAVGLLVGSLEGMLDGCSVGVIEGDREGCSEGIWDGDEVGGRVFLLPPKLPGT